MDGTAGKQVYFAAENALELLLKLEKIPTQAGSRFKRNEQVDITAGLCFPSGDRTENLQAGNMMPLAKGHNCRFELAERSEVRDTVAMATLLPT